jgi:hypothetical protein
VLYGTTCVVYVGTLTLAAWALPDPLASHFSPAGLPNQWESRTSYLITNLILGVAILGGLPALGVVSGRHPRSINIGNREYWSRPEHRDEFRRGTLTLFLVLASITALFIDVTQVVLVWANRTTPTTLPAFPYGLPAVAFALLTVATAFLYLRRKHRQDSP